MSYDGSTGSHTPDQSGQAGPTAHHGYPPPGYQQPSSGPNIYADSQSSGSPYANPTYANPESSNYPYGNSQFTDSRYEAAVAPAYQNPGYGLQPSYGARPTNGLATASLICGLLGFMLPFVCIAAVVTGHLSLAQIKRTGENGRGMAVAGLILGWLVTALGLLAMVAFVVFAVAAPRAGG